MPRHVIPTAELLDAVDVSMLFVSQIHGLKQFKGRIKSIKRQNIRQYMDTNIRNEHSTDSIDGERQERRSSNPRRGGKRPYYKKKIDKIEAHNLTIDYKHPEILRRFITDNGKILPRRITGTGAKNHRRLVREIKKARFLALLPLG